MAKRTPAFNVTKHGSVVTTPEGGQRDLCQLYTQKHKVTHGPLPLSLTPPEKACLGFLISHLLMGVFPVFPTLSFAQYSAQTLSVIYLSQPAPKSEAIRLWRANPSRVEL